MWWRKDKKLDAILKSSRDNGVILVGLYKMLAEIQENQKKQEKQIMADSQQLVDLTAEVANATTVEQSALVLIQGFAAQLAAAGTDPAKLQALKDSLAASDAALAAAVVANTPAAPPAPAPAS